MDDTALESVKGIAEAHKLRLTYPPLKTTYASLFLLAEHIPPEQQRHVLRTALANLLSAGFPAFVVYIPEGDGTRKAGLWKRAAVKLNPAIQIDDVWVP